MASTLGHDYRYEISEPPYTCSVWTGAPTKPKVSSTNGNSKFDPWCENQNKKQNTTTTTSTASSAQLSPFDNSFVTEAQEDRKSSFDGGSPRSPSSEKSAVWSDTEPAKGYSLWNSECAKTSQAPQPKGSSSSTRSSTRAKSSGSPAGSLSSGASASPKWTSPDRKPKAKVDVTDAKYITNWISTAMKKESMLPSNLMDMVTTSAGVRGNNGKNRCSFQQKVKWNTALKNCNGTLLELYRLYQRMQNYMNMPLNSSLRENYEIGAVEVYYVIKQTMDMSGTLEPVVSRLMETSGEFKKRGYFNPRKLATFQTLAGEALGNLTACSKFLYVMYPLVESLMEARDFDPSGTEELDTIIALVNHLDFLLLRVFRAVSHAYHEIPQDDPYKNNAPYFSNYPTPTYKHGPARSAYGYM